MKIINLLFLTDQSEHPGWGLGKVFPCQPRVTEICAILDNNLEEGHPDAWFFWDSRCGHPNEELLLQLLESSADCWHAGLALGLEGQPEIIDFVSPTWMLNRDPDSSIEATSWRLSLRACLVRADVLRQLGGPRSEFESLEMASLELGFRYIRKGAFIRHVPNLLEQSLVNTEVDISVQDQLLFLKYSFGEQWLRWAVFRGMLTGFARPLDLLIVWRKVRKFPVAEMVCPLERVNTARSDPSSATVSVLIPTLRRYPYLRTLLDQLRRQTVPPFEVLVVDQTPAAERDLGLKDEFADLPIQWFFLDQAGQCCSRNLGLQKSKGDFILFLDDDDEIQPDLIQKHLSNLIFHQTNISSGVALETGTGELPIDFRFKRASDVFPTNNSMIRRCVLHKTGLFDLAYDRGQRADHDLGMRLYLSGEMMILNPQVEVLHHHAPVGGLREHKARVNTYAASRSKVFSRVLPSVSDLYLSKRYFTPKQVRERLWIDIFGTFRLKGPAWKRLLKVLVSTISLPANIHLVNKREEIAQQMLTTYPQIPDLQNEAP
ncbi:MAG: glycosyltransferase family 2 protein [Anaerolineaceae bacterium]|nr:glycosyltransferase family 2 protein [Anaerolineaceae bacterium]